MLQKMFPKNGASVPEIRFAGFTGDWERRKLGEVCERVTRKNKNKESDLPLTIASQYGLVAQGDFFNKIVAAKDMSNYYLLKKGEFAYNKKGGIASPTYGAKIDIHNAYLHDNDYGVFAQCPASYNNYKISDTIKIYNCTIKHNKQAGVLAEGYNVYAYSCLFEGNKQEHSLVNDGTFTAENCTRRDQRLSVIATNETLNRLKFDMTELKALGITTLKNLFSDGQACTVFTKIGLVELTIKQRGDEQIIFNEPIAGIAVGDILVTSMPDSIEATKVVAKEIYAHQFTICRSPIF